MQAAFVYLLLIPLRLVGPVPRPIPVIDGLLTVIAVAIPRFALCWAGRYHTRASKPSGTTVTVRALIVGAGDAASLVLRELRANPQLGVVPVGLVDDDPLKQRLRMDGCRVQGTRHDIPRLVRDLGADRIIIAMPSASGTVIRELVDICQQTGVESLTLPGVYELLSKKVDVQRMRKIQIEDLLRREPVRIDSAKVMELLRDRRVMVTGAGGSIGGELCRQIASCEPSELILLGHGENSIFHASNELSREFPGLLSHPVIADVRDWDRRP